MILFREEYKKANDNIKVDNELLEKTLRSAFVRPLPKKRKFNYTAITKVAAAVIVAVGCTAAYPALVEKPEIDTVVVNEPISTPTEETVIMEKEPEKTQAIPTKKPVRKKVESAPVVASVQTEIAVPENPISRMIEPESAIAYSEEDFISPVGFEQISVIYNEDGTEDYVYEGLDEKIISVHVSASEESQISEPQWKEDGESVGVIFSKDGKLLDVTAENMTREEITDAFSKHIQTDKEENVE